MPLSTQNMVIDTKISALINAQVHVFPKASITSSHISHKPLIVVNTCGFLKASVLPSSTSALASKTKSLTLSLLLWSNEETH